MKVKEKWLEELNYLKVKFERIKSKDGKIRGNNMFQEDQGNFYRSIKAKQERKGNVSAVKMFVSFWAGITEDVSITPHKEWTERVARNIQEKVTDIVHIMITEER